MPTLDELLQQTEQPATTTPQEPGRSPSPAPTPQAPPGPSPLDSLLQQSAQGDPSLDFTKDEEPPYVRAQRTLFGRALPRPSRPDGGFDVSDVLGGFTETLGSAMRAPAAAVEAAQNLRPAENSLEEALRGYNPLVKGLNTLGKGLEFVGERLSPRGEEELPWYEDLDRGIGSAAAFIAGGSSRTALDLGPTAMTALLGGAVGATDQYEEALLMGGDPEQAALAYLGGAAFGMSEAIPGTYFLNKLNILSKGKMYETLKAFNMTKEGGPIREAIKSFLLEGGQEGFQTWGSNWIARDIAGYDPTRSLGENFWSSVLTGGVTGSMVGGGIELLRKAERGQALASFEELRKQRLASGDLINDISGSFTPVEDLLALRSMRDKLEEDILTQGQRLADEYSGITSVTGNMTEGQGPLIPPAIQRPTYTGLDYNEPNIKAWVDKHISPLVVDSSIEKALPRNADGSPLNVLKAFETTPVVAAVSDPFSFEALLPYKEMLAKANEYIIKAEDSVKSAKTVEEKTQRQKSLDALHRTRNAIMAKQKIARDVIKEAKDYIAAFREAINPELRILVTDNPSYAQPKRTEYGSFALVNNLELANKARVPLGILYINMDEIVTEAYNNKGQMNAAGKMRLFETLSHELGHSIAMKGIGDLIAKINGPYPAGTDPKVAQAEATKAYATFSFLVDEYDRWLRDAATSNQDFWRLTQAAAFRGENMKLAFDPTKAMGTPFKIKQKGMMEYLLSFDEFFAEMTARLASRGDLADPVMTKYFSPLMKIYQGVFDKLPEYAQNEYGKNWLKFLQSRTATFKIQQMVEGLAAGGGKNLLTALKGKIPGLNPDNFVGLQAHLDKWSWGMDLGFNLIQMSKENPHIPHWKNYLNGVELWQNYQRKFAALADGVLVKWKGLAKAEAAKLSDVLFEEATEKKLLDKNELAKRLGPDAFLVYTEVRNQFNYVLEEMRLATIRDAEVTYGDRTTALQEELKEIDAEFNKLKNGGYFPFMRYGKYTITAVAKEELTYNGVEFKPGQIITFPVFENQRERDLEIASLRKQLGNKATVSSSVMSETDMVIQGMPRALLRSLKNKMEAAGPISKEQQAAFDKAFEDTAPFRNFRKQFVKKRYIFGYSEDAMRSFANYMGSAAGHISRVKYADLMREPILGMQEDVEVIKAIGGRADERQKMKHWLDEHFKYLMNPENELAALRSVGFVAYLGFSVKSAFVNMTQPFLITLPYLSARYGDLASIEALGRATWTLKDWVSKRKDFLDAVPPAEGLSPSRPNDKRARQLRLISQAIEEGWIDQSLATELALARSENNLDRGLYLQKGKRFWHEASRLSALPFHLVEKMNRYITAFAAYDLEFQESQDHAKAVLAAKQANWSTNYENSRWNRPKFMRGKKSVFFLFTNYVQNTIYFATHDAGATRYLLSMLLMAGLLGLPGAEDLEDVVDFSVTALNKLLGIENPKFALRQELRENLEHLGANPDIVLHGLSQNSFGWGHIGELLGLPIPRFDLSGSLGMGDIVPLTGVPKMLQSGRDPQGAMMEGLAEAGGASTNLVATFYKGLTSTDPDDVRAMEKAMPLMSLRNIMKAVRYKETGQEVTRSGDVVASFDEMDLRDNLEILGQALGFTPTKVSQGWERQIAVMDAIQYYKVRQSSLLGQHNWALWNEDQEASRDVLDEIRRYNDEVPFPEMGITGETLKRSARTYLQDKLKANAGLSVEKKYLRLKEKVESSYPDPWGKDQKEEIQPEL